MVSIRAYRPNCPGFESRHSQFFFIVDVAQANQRHCLEESELRHENVDQTHLVVASGKLVPQKS